MLKRRVAQLPSVTTTRLPGVGLRRGRSWLAATSPGATQDPLEANEPGIRFATPVAVDPNAPITEHIPDVPGGVLWKSRTVSRDVDPINELVHPQGARQIILGATEYRVYGRNVADIKGATAIREALTFPDERGVVVEPVGGRHWAHYRVGAFSVDLESRIQLEKPTSPIRVPGRGDTLPGWSGTVAGSDLIDSLRQGYPRRYEQVKERLSRLQGHDVTLNIVKEGAAPNAVEVHEKKHAENFERSALEVLAPAIGRINAFCGVEAAVEGLSPRLATNKLLRRSGNTSAAVRLLWWEFEARREQKTKELHLGEPHLNFAPSSVSVDLGGPGSGDSVSIVLATK